MMTFLKLIKCLIFLKLQNKFFQNKFDTFLIVKLGFINMKSGTSFGFKNLNTLNFFNKNV